MSGSNARHVETEFCLALLGIYLTREEEAELPSAGMEPVGGGCANAENRAWWHGSLEGKTKDRDGQCSINRHTDSSVCRS